MELPNLSTNKKLDELSSEDLLKALESSPDNEHTTIPIPDDTPPVLEFIQRFKLVSGEHKVESRLLWKLYLQYYPMVITRKIFTEHANKILKYEKAAFYLNVTSEYLYGLLIDKVPKLKRIDTLSANTHFSTFFEKIKVVSGKHKIPWFTFFHLYRCYCIDNKIKPRSKQAFLAYISKFFKSVTSNDGSLFLVDKDTAHSIDKKDYDNLKKIYKEKYPKR
jgi:hypothetical protein